MLFVSSNEAYYGEALQFKPLHHPCLAVAGPRATLGSHTWTSFGHLNYPGGSSKLSSRWSPVRGCSVRGHQRRPGQESLQPPHTRPDSSTVSRAQWSWVIHGVFGIHETVEFSTIIASLNLVAMMF